MELLKSIEKIFNNCKNYKECKNFYFENHICGKTGETIKVELNFKLSNDKTDKIVRIGMCQECNTLFYKYDYESKSI